MAELHTVGVVGAGTMGAGIAQVAAAAGHPVLLFDALPGLAEKAKARLAEALEKLVGKGRLTAAERDALLARIQPCTEISALAPARLVIEAIIEDLAAKQNLFRQLEALVAADAILATNTSSLSVTAIANGLARPGSFAGMHFFNPAPLMPLVEVIAGTGTASGVLDSFVTTAKSWGKTPVRAKDSPGFIVNRGARPFYNEGLRFLEERGADAATIDSLLRAAGFRMGPLELIDLVGLDVSLAVSRSIAAACPGETRLLPSRLVEEHVAAGQLGRKTGRGFYDYAVGAKATRTVMPPCAAPKHVAVHGHLDPAHALPEIWEAHGVEVALVDVPPGQAWLEVDGVRAALTDGRAAHERAAEDGLPWVVFDLTLDYTTCPHLALAASDASSPAVQKVAGLFQLGGRAVSLVPDLPGLLVARTLAMLMNESADLVARGVATAGDVDLAMVKGLNFPGGPLGWADRVGARYAVTLLDHLATVYGERYCASALLRRHAEHGGKFHE